MEQHGKSTPSLTVCEPTTRRAVWLRIAHSQENACAFSINLAHCCHPMGITHLLREMLLSEITAAVQALGVPRILRELRLSSNRATGMLFCKTITRAKTPLAFKDVLFFFSSFFFCRDIQPYGLQRLTVFW
jgi:hypothetical protein